MKSGINPNNPLRGTLFKGSLWMLGMRLSIRGIGLISTIILARLLTPDDFGVVAMAMLAVGLLEVLSSFGVDMALINKQDAHRVHYDTAWTLQLLQRVLIALLIFAFAIPISGYFNEPRIVPVLQVLSVAIFIEGFTNIGIVAFRKELDFAREFRYGVYNKVITFVVTISLALLMKNYWALAIGILSGRVLSVVISYLMHEYRPKLCLKAVRELWSFSQWMLVSNITWYFNSKIDEIAIGGFKSTRVLGIYNVSVDLATLPTSEIIAPVSRALYPGYAKLKEDTARLGRAFLDVLGVVALLSMSLSFGIAAVSDDFVHLVLGEQWSEAVPVIEWIAIYGAFIAIASSASYLLIVQGGIKALAVINLISVLLVAPLIVYVVSRGSIVDVAIVRAGFAVFYCLAMFYGIVRYLPISMFTILGRLWRPMVAGVLMLVIVRQLHLEHVEIRLITMACDVIIGSVSYVLLCLVLWLLAGRPDGAEKTLWNIAKERMNRRAATA